jgi:hypothetical protein
MSEQTGTSLAITIQGEASCAMRGILQTLHTNFHGQCNAASTRLCFCAAYTALPRSSLTGTAPKDCQVLTDMSAISRCVPNSAAFMSEQPKEDSGPAYFNLLHTRCACRAKSRYVLDSRHQPSGKGNWERRMKPLYPDLTSNRTISVPESSLLCEVASQARNEDPT